MRCASSILCFWDTWVESEKRLSNFDFPLPKSWKIPVTFAKPYEHHLRTRWPDCLFQMLNLSREDLLWWNSPVQVLKKQQVFSFCGFRPPVTQVNKTKKSSGKSTKSTSITIPKPSTSSGFDSQWPPIKSQHVNVVPTNHNFFKDLQGVDEQLWNFCDQYLICPLASKYHSINTDILLQSGGPECDPHFMAVGPWFAMWACAFGPQALDFVEEEYVKNINIMNSCKYTLLYF